MPEKPLSKNKRTRSARRALCPNNKQVIIREIGELQIYFRKIPLHQQKFLVVSFFFNLRWLPKNLKNVQNETNKLFSVGNTFRQATMQDRIFCIYCAMI